MFSDIKRDTSSDLHSAKKLAMAQDSESNALSRYHDFFFFLQGKTYSSCYYWYFFWAMHHRCTTLFCKVFLEGQYPWVLVWSSQLVDCSPCCMTFPSRECVQCVYGSRLNFLISVLLREFRHRPPACDNNLILGSWHWRLITSPHIVGWACEKCIFSVSVRLFVSLCPT